jgi:hypothetical protein
VVFQAQIKVVQKVRDPAGLIDVRGTGLDVAGEMVVHQHYPRRVNIDSSGDNLSKVASNTMQIAFCQGLVEDQLFVSVKQGEMNALAPETFEQPDNPLLQGNIGQLKAGSMNPLAHPFQYHRLGYGETFHQFRVVDYPVKRCLLC